MIFNDFHISHRYLMIYDDIIDAWNHLSNASQKPKCLKGKAFGTTFTVVQYSRNLSLNAVESVLIALSISIYKYYTDILFYSIWRPSTFGSRTA